MLLRLILENFLSFETAQEFHMFPNRKREGNVEHIYSSNGIPLLKQAAIYGNNAAGKSNLFKGINTLRRFALEEAFLTEAFVTRHRYRLSSNQDVRPIELLVEFETQDQPFIYDVAVSERGVEREDLYLSGVGSENTLLYHRALETVELGEALQKAQQEQWQHTKDIVERMLGESHRYASFLSLLKTFPVLEDKAVARAYSWFKEELSVIGMHSELPRLIELLDQNEKVLNFVNRVFLQLSIGVDGVEVNTTDADEWLRSHSGSITSEDFGQLKDNQVLSAYSSTRRPLFSTLSEQGKMKVQELLFKQVSEAGTFDLDIQDQSDGTVRLLTLLPAIYSAVKSKKTVFIDEINHCLHPQLLFDLVRFFGKSTTRGQLIFSTHETELMEQNRLLRSDEIWLVEKVLGSSTLYSLDEFKLHHTTSIRRGYREGRFGGSYEGAIELESNA
ncbi:MAG: ATP-binding protein [Porphyromonadaceae bacterium]|jgi:transporter|uniref:AAA family ATPase n=1 Tax=Porphyromonas bobii TaxID=2811780 RepID=UPI001C005E5E|nr:ATP-binding protein [Porphyromonas bobii]MBF1365200.1 ATP-binding protein [Porphyromonadaceae bacterium]